MRQPGHHRMLPAVLLLSGLTALAPVRASADPPPKAAQTLSEEDLRSRYAGALRHFYKELEPRHAQQIAERVIVESRKHGIDGRLAIAVLIAGAGTERLSTRDRELRIEGKAVEEFIGGLAGDLSARIRRHAGPSVPDETAVRRALEERARAKGRRGRAVEALVERELKLYRQLSGRSGQG